MAVDIRDFIRDVPDFPKPGILFKDVTPLLSDAAAFEKSVDLLAERYRAMQIDKIVAIESRGFIFGGPLALKLGVGFVPVRKPGKLPYETVSHSYELEYGTDTLEIHTDAVKPGDKVLLVDDLLATGGTVEACLKLLSGFEVEIVECAFCIHLKFLEGEKKLQPNRVFSLLEY